MKIHGNAYRVQVTNSQGTHDIRQGEVYQGMQVQGIMAGVEDNIVHLIIASPPNSRHMTFQRAEVEIDWAQKPSIQSRTEWTMWTAEVIGHSQDMSPRDVSESERKFYPNDHVPGARPEAEPKPYKTVPMVAGAATGPFRVVNNPAPDLLDNCSRALPTLSDQRRGVDADAGGPEGFDVDAVGIPDGAEVYPINDPIVVSPKSNDGERMIMVHKREGMPELQGRTMVCKGEQLVVQSVELAEHEGQEVLCLRVK